MARKAPDLGRIYRTAAFAALVGLTPRALRHYDRLGLLKPRRSATGYRIYTAGDLETLEEIVALKFIGIPLKDIPAIRRRSRGPFANALRAQRQTLEARQRTLARAIAAIAAAETAVASGTPIDVSLFRQIIEVMQMDTNHEETIAKYVAVLKSKSSHLSKMSSGHRAARREQWLELVSDIKAGLDEDPGSPAAQSLLDRWLSFLEALTGTAALAPGSGDGFQPTSGLGPEVRDEVWARRAEWMPPSASRDASTPADADAALTLARKLSESFANPEVLDFIKRARAARMG